MRILTALPPLTIALVAIPAAASTSNVPTAAVQTGDLDLTDDADHAALNQRIQLQVRTMCRSGIGGALGAKMDKQCRITAIANAERAVNVAIASAAQDAAQDKVRLAATGSQTPGA